MAPMFRALPLPPKHFLLGAICKRIPKCNQFLSLQEPRNLKMIHTSRSRTTPWIHEAVSQKFLFQKTFCVICV